MLIYKNTTISKLKKRYIDHIINLASNFSFIEQIILFGSSVDESRCREDSDIDILILSNKTKYQTLRSKEYKEFTSAIYSLDYSQDYDIICVKSFKDLGVLKEDIEKEGVILYESNKK